MWSRNDGAHQVLHSTALSFGRKGNDGGGLDRWSLTMANRSGRCAVLGQSLGMWPLDWRRAGGGCPR
jgi:hypothetical protein